MIEVKILRDAVCHGTFLVEIPASFLFCIGKKACLTRILGVSVLVAPDVSRLPAGVRVLPLVQPVGCGRVSPTQGLECLWGAAAVASRRCGGSGEAGSAEHDGVQEGAPAPLRPSVLSSCYRCLVYASRRLLALGFPEASGQSLAHRHQRGYASPPASPAVSEASPAPCVAGVYCCPWTEGRWEGGPGGMSGCPAVTPGQQLSDSSSLSRDSGWVTLPGAVGPARGFPVFLTLEGRARGGGGQGGQFWVFHTWPCPLL